MVEEWKEWRLGVEGLDKKFKKRTEERDMQMTAEINEQEVNSNRHWLKNNRKTNGHRQINKVERDR